MARTLHTRHVSHAYGFVTVVLTVVTTEEETKSVDFEENKIRWGDHEREEIILGPLVVCAARQVSSSIRAGFSTTRAGGTTLPRRLSRGLVLFCTSAPKDVLSALAKFGQYYYLGNYMAMSPTDAPGLLVHELVQPRKLVGTRATYSIDRILLPIHACARHMNQGSEALPRRTNVLRDCKLDRK